MDNIHLILGDAMVEMIMGGTFGVIVDVVVN